MIYTINGLGGADFFDDFAKEYVDVIVEVSNSYNAYVNATNGKMNTAAFICNKLT